MIHFKRILVPIDFSEYSKNALQFSIHFARQFRAELVLIYVVESIIYPADFSFGQVGFPNVEDELRRKGEDEIEKLIKKEIKKSVKARRIIRTGKPFVEITKAANDEKVDLIIIASHGHTGVEHMLFGSTAEKVIRKAPCPVLVLRPSGQGFILP